MKTSDLRKIFLDFFKSKGHTCVQSASLVPKNDPTLLFTNAGMVPFKDIFLGLEKCDHKRITSSQKCFRAKGKHNDLENVGFTARHHTFFEMLGNFSFGDYFKKEAIEFAWEFVTKILKFSEDRLWVTVFINDHETANIWINKIGINPKRLVKCGERDNFWTMGDSGPCGPCTEIFYDHGSSIIGNQPGSKNTYGDRYVEIWNLVFMQYNKELSGKLTLLPNPCVDTGMGLERTAAIIQGVHSNYDIDLFKNIIVNIAKMFDIQDTRSKSLQVIADHLRSCAFLIIDGVLPSNEGRGYVLRRIIRRAIRHGRKIGIHIVFFYKLVPILINEMGNVFSELNTKKLYIAKIFQKEEEQFDKTLDYGLALLEKEIQHLSGKQIPGELIFKLYDTYGFPVDLTADIVREHGLTMNMQAFNQKMENQKYTARNSSTFCIKKRILTNKKTEFTGYERISDIGQVVALFKEDQVVNKIMRNETGIVILDKTPFYAESGGQIGDTGFLINNNLKFLVYDTQKFQNAFAHFGKNLGQEIRINDKFKSIVDKERRLQIMSNHSATHLVHAALRQILGLHVKQKGSMVDEKRLRFDFLHNKPMTYEEINAVDLLVNQKIQENTDVSIHMLPIQQAKNINKILMFNEDKYSSNIVRVLNIGQDFSMELCGGTHVDRTGNIGFFKIISESSASSGMRRIEALTGNTAVKWVQSQQTIIQRLSKIIKIHPVNLPDKFVQLTNKLHFFEKQNTKLQLDLINEKNIVDLAKTIKGIKVLSAKLFTGDMKLLRTLVDQFKQKLGSSVIVLGVASEEKVRIVAGVHKNCIERINAIELINSVARQVDGKGGGRADMAQAGGIKPLALERALESVYTWVEYKL